MVVGLGEVVRRDCASAMIGCHRGVELTVQMMGVSRSKRAQVLLSDPETGRVALVTPGSCVGHDDPLRLARLGCRVRRERQPLGPACGTIGGSR